MGSIERLWKELEQKHSTIVWAKQIKDTLLILKKKEYGTGLEYLYYDIHTQNSSSTTLPCPSKLTIFSPSRHLAIQFNSKLRISPYEDIDQCNKKQIPQRIDIWNIHNGCLTSIAIPKNLHSVLFSGEFGLPTVCPMINESTLTERYLLYTAEAFYKRSAGLFTDDKNDDSNRLNRFEYRQTWGETHAGQSLGRLFIVDIHTERVLQVEWKNDDESLGQPTWIPDGSGFAVTAWKTKPWRLGTSFCQDRLQTIYICAFKDSLDVSFADAANDTLQLFIAAEVGLPTNVAAMHSPLIYGTMDSWFLTACGVSTENCGPHWSNVSLIQAGPFTSNASKSLLPFQNNKRKINSVITTQNNNFTLEVSRHGSEAFPLPSGFLLPNVIEVKEDYEGLQLLYYNSNKNQFFQVPVVENDKKDGIYRVLDICYLDCADKIQVVCENSSPSKASALISTVLKLNNEGLELVKTSQLDYQKQNVILYAAEDVLEWKAVNSPCRYWFCLPTTPNSQARGIILLLHGGPNSLLLPEYTLPVTFLRSLGYCIVAPNYTGSLGQDDEGIHKLAGKIGELDVKDCVQALEHFKTIANMQTCHDIYLCGGSHGGFLSLMLAGNTTIEFNAASVRNPVTDLYFNFTSSDIPDWSVFNGLGNSIQGTFQNVKALTVEQVKEMYLHSPIAYVDNVKTPILLALGENDLRVPPSQGLEYFRYLIAKNDLSMARHKLLWYPQNGHAISHPECLADYWVNTAEWFEQWGSGAKYQYTINLNASN